MLGKFLLSKKYKDFIKSHNKGDALEGTTAAGKTTVGIFCFLLKVASSPKKMHVIAAQNLGVAEKNIINKDFGITDIFGDLVEYHPRGKGEDTMAHILYHTPNGDKIIYIVGYDNVSRWKTILGGQYGCVYIDEINTADMAFVRQVIMRCDYWMATMNPDDPDRPIYKEIINRCRPDPRYKNDAPQELLDCLDEPEHEGWVWWYFDFDDNLGLTEEKKAQIKSAHTPGSVDYKHYILGLRGKAEGVIFDNFAEKTHCITQAEILKMAHETNPNNEIIVKYTAGMDTAYSSKSDDTIAMTFLGITNKRRLIYIDECVINNRDTKIPFAPSDVAKKFVAFLDKNRDMYGFARDVFIDSADQATITELNKYRMMHGCIYNFYPAYKKVKIIDRIIMQKGWIAKGQYVVCNLCKEHIREMQVYSWAEGNDKTIPGDANNHTIDSQCYGWIPFRTEIG